MSKVNIAMKTTRGGAVLDDDGKPVVVSRVIRKRNLRGQEVDVVKVDGRIHQVHRRPGRGLPFIWANRPMKEQAAEPVTA